MRRFLLTAFFLMLMLTACGKSIVITIYDAPTRLPASQTPTVTASPSPSPTLTHTPLPSPTIAPVLREVVTTANVNLRAGAGTAFSVLTVIPQGTELQVTGQNADGTWLNVRYNSFTGWVSAAFVGDIPDPTPTRERISYNINGEAVADTNYLLQVMTNPCKTTALVMNNLGLGIRIRQSCPETIIVSRSWSPLEGDEWFYRSPQNFVDQCNREGHKDIVRHSTNEPSFGGTRTVQAFVAAEIELMRLARLSGCTYAMGNFSVGYIRPEWINAGLFDPYLRALNQYGHYLGVHEYACCALPFGVGQWSASWLIDRTRVQEASWPVAAALPVRLWDNQLPPYWYLRRADWFLLRADAIGVPRPRILVTEFGWDNLPDIKSYIEPLRQQFGIDRYFDDMRGVNTYRNLWAYYWPDWSFAQAACEQLLWADSIYPKEYIGFMLFTWSTHPHWLQTDFSGRENPDMPALHNCLRSRDSR